MYYSHLFPDLILFKIYIHRPGRGWKTSERSHPKNCEGRLRRDKQKHQNQWSGKPSVRRAKLKCQ